MSLSNLSLANVVKVAGGHGHSLAVTADGKLYSWGLNADGQLGDGTLTNKTTPTQVGTDSDWADVACGDHHSLGLKTDGKVWAWGRNGSGQLGDGTTDGKTTPTLVSQSTFSKIAAGSDRSFAITGSPAGATGGGSLYGWGANSGRQIDFNSGLDKTTPFVMAQNAVLVATCPTMTAFVTTDNSFYFRGAYDVSISYPVANFSDSAYSPNTINYTSYFLTSAVASPPIALGVGAEFLLAITQAGELYGFTFKEFWSNALTAPTPPDEAQTAIGAYGIVFGVSGGFYYPTHNIPALIDDSRHWLRLASGREHALLTDIDGNVFSIGNNDYGQLGRTATGNDPNIVQLESPANAGNWGVIGCGNYHSLLCVES
jgi:alpha-tubulin suppressor-like RCC1 family protein